MSSEEDRQALLEKIRADMASSRQKIAEMKEKKARGTIVLDTATPEQEASDADKFKETTSLVEKLRAERAAKKAGDVAKETPSTDTNSGETNAGMRVRKLSVDTRERSPSIAKRFLPAREQEGRRPSIGGDTRRPSIGGGARFRTPSIDQGDGRRPSIGGDTRKPSIGGGQRMRQASVDQGRKISGTKGNGSVKRAATTGSDPRPIKKIGSLSDMQKLIEKAGEVKKNAEIQREEEEKKRQVREARKNEMSREERRAYRESKRMTVEMQQNESRVKIDQQIGGFMMMMQKLESDWQKGEEARIKALEDMAEQRKLMEKIGNQMEFLTSSLNDLSARMDHMKLMIDRLVDSAPKSAKKDDQWFKKLSAFQEKFWKMRHEAYISTAKYKKMMEEQQEEERKKEVQNAAPGAPPPVPVPTPGGGGGMVNPISNLLSQIRQGTNLKKLDPKQVEEEKKQRKGNWRQSVALLQGLQDTLRDALDQRHLSLFSDEESDEDWDDEEDEED